MSSVAGIVDIKGGIRIVVTDSWRMKYHVNKGERLFTVPNLRVAEPVSWGAVPNLIETVESYVRSQL